MKDRTLINEIQEVIDQRKNQPKRLNALLNLKLQDASREEGYSKFIFDAEEWSLNPYGAVHGGAICSAFDTAMGISAVALSQHFVSTTDLSVSYLKPMKGKQYLFDIEFTHVGRRLIRFLGKAYNNETGELCATAVASFMVTETKAKGLQV